MITAATVAATVIGLLVSGAGVWITSSNHQADVDTKLIELSIGILQGEPKPETDPLRKWAISTLQTKGNFVFKPDEKDALQKTQLPPTTGTRGFLQQQAVPPPQQQPTH